MYKKQCADKMQSAVGFRLFVLLLAACVLAAEASRPNKANVDDREEDYAEPEGMQKRGKPLTVQDM